MSALMLLRGLSFSTRNICSSLSKEMKFPNQERFANLSEKGWLEGESGRGSGNKPFPHPLTSLPCQTHSGEDSGVKLDISSAVGTGGRGGRGEYGQHLPIILGSSTRASSPLQPEVPDPGAHAPPSN